LTGPPPGIAGKGAEIIKADIQCSPCFERTCKNNDMRCMYSIVSDDVFHVLQDVLPTRPAVFFDRDGTLCKDTGYPNSFDDLHVFPEIDSLKRLKERGFMLVGVSNQSGIARGLVNREFVEQANEMFISKYGFDDFLYCPHHPDEQCQCRKPEPEILLRARLQYGIDLRKSYVVGDKETDMMLARAVGARGILVQTGKEQESQRADFVAKDLKDAVEFILRK
jgi:heptosyltransferase-2